MIVTKNEFDADELFTSAPRVTVKFKLAQDQTFTMPFSIETSTDSIKKELSCLLKIPFEDLILSQDSKVLDGGETLADFANTQWGSITMDLFTDHYIDLNALSNQIYGDVAMRDVICVNIGMGDGKEPEYVLVEIIKENFKKAFTGGYRDRLTGKEYHHGSSQTSFSQKNFILKAERDCQTALDIASKQEGTPGHKLTQTPRLGLYLIDPQNIIIFPKKYISVKECEEKAIALQKYWRRWKLRTKMSSDKFGAAVEVREMEMFKSQEVEEIKDMHHIKQLSQFPMDKEDGMNGEKAPNQEIGKTFTGYLEKCFNKYLLMKDIEKLRTQEMEKISALEIIQKTHNLNMIKKLSQPMVFISKNGSSISMETEQHREFCDWYEIYRRFVNDELSKMERRLLLKSIQAKLESHGDRNNAKIQDLINKQLDLLDVGVDCKYLVALQKITEKHIMEFLEDFATRFFPKKQINCINQSKNQVQACKNCKQVKHESSFKGNSQTNGGKVCKSCFWLENMSRRRVDYAVYQSILHSIQREEELHNCSFSMAFILQVEDVHYIVNTIWHGKSIISEIKDISHLRLCRFDNAIAWSPWNCFLITEKEMRAHAIVDNPLEVYGSWLFEQVRTKHLMGRLHFQKLWKKSSNHIQSKDWENMKRLHDIIN